MKKSRSVRRGGFTLMEVMTALAITGLVATVAASALRAGLDVRERVQRHRLTINAEARITTWLTSMLRHPPVASAVNEPLFSVSQSLNGSDSLTFLSQGVASPIGVGTIWRVTVHSDARGLHVRAVSTSPSGQQMPMESVLPHVNGLVVEAFEGRAAAGSATPWLRAWPVLRSMPAAVRMTFVLRDGSARAPLVFAVAPLVASLE